MLVGFNSNCAMARIVAQLRVCVEARILENILRLSVSCTQLQALRTINDFSHTTKTGLTKHQKG